MSPILTSPPETEAPAPTGKTRKSVAKKRPGISSHARRLKGLRKMPWPGQEPIEISVPDFVGIMTGLMEDFGYRVTGTDPVAIYETGIATVPDFDRALGVLCEIRKRRMKFSRIEQRIRSSDVDVDDIAARALIGYGILGTRALAERLRIQKITYDLDNRLAQETGYLMTHVVTAVLGGQGHGARTSPVFRTEGNFSRRSVDCIVENRAYDFKARLTEAASRRARFADEQAFARDCAASGFIPILLVLHCRSGERPEELIETYRRYGGEAHVGDEAWAYLMRAASPTMATILTRHVLPFFDMVRTQAALPESR